jgi:hypothetical protein
MLFSILNHEMIVNTYVLIINFNIISFAVCDVEDGKSNRVQYKGPDPKLAEMLERDVLETSPGVRWYDVASLTEAKRLLGEAIVLEYSLYGCLNISR